MSVLKTLSFLFDQGVQTRNALYDKGYLESRGLPVPVISVGNLSVGGTGKTSFVIWLLRSLSERGLRVGVISRGYGGKVSSFAQVPAGGDPKKYGDEPCLIANEKIGPVFVGPRRVEVGHELLRRHQVDLIVADDAFQHRRLKRDVDVVLLDLSESVKNYQLLPAGRLREGFDALARADVVVSTKRSFSDGESLSLIDSKIPSGKIRLEMDYRLSAILNHKGEPLNDWSGDFLLVSGVAKPKTVENLVHGQVQISDHLVFGDHHSYTSGDLANIIKKARELKVRAVLTTAKDAVKLREFDELAEQLCVLNLDYVVKGQLNEFFEMVIGKAR